MLLQLLPRTDEFMTVERGSSTPFNIPMEQEIHDYLFYRLTSQPAQAL